MTEFFQLIIVISVLIFARSIANNVDYSVPSSINFEISHNYERM